ncbi:MAG TPA: hypothetical protein VH257_08620 [Chloroflexota bacterium]|nr:hypothetical protein [Chloroflexota bacterium]
MSADDRAALAGAFPATHAYYAGLVRDPLTEVERYPAPFFERAAVFRIVHRHPFHPAILYAAAGPDGTAVLLTDDPAAFAALARAAGAVIASPADALAYALAYLELTGPRAELRYVIRTAGEARFVPRPRPAEQARIDQFLATYAPLVHPPRVSDAEDGFLVTLYAVRQRELQRHVLRVSPGGALAHQVDVCERGLPLVAAV